MNGALITFEGGDGTGKSTQIKKLTQKLKSLGYRVVLSREPGGTPVGEILRKIIKAEPMSPLTELFLFEAGRAEHVEKLICPALKKGEVVILDRYAESSLIYQGVGRGLGLSFVKKANEMAMQGIHAHLIIHLDSKDHGVLHSRRKSRKTKDRFETERSSFHRKIEIAFRRLASSDRRFRTFDATKSIKELHEDILKVVLQKLGSLGVNRRRA